MRIFDFENPNVRTLLSSSSKMLAWPKTTLQEVVVLVLVL